MLRAGVEGVLLPVCHPRQEFPPGGPIAVQGVEGDHAWDLPTPVQEYAEARLGGNVIASALREGFCQN